MVESGVTAPCGYLSTIQSGAIAARVGKTSTFDLDFNQLRETPAGHLSVSSLLEHTGVHHQRHSDQVVERGDDHSPNPFFRTILEVWGDSRPV